MSSPLPSRLHRAVLVDPAKPRLRVAELDQRWVEHAELCAALGVEGAWGCAPSWWETPDRVVHLLVGAGDLPEDGWLPDHDLSMFDPDTAAWLHTSYDAWRAGTLAIPGQPWWSATWVDDVLDWVDAVLPAAGLARVGAPVPTKMWSLSAVLRVPVAGTGGERDLWFKATCDWFRAEPALTAVVASLVPAITPDVVAVDADRAWILMEELPAADAEPAHLAVPVAAGLATLQLAADQDALVAAGVEVRSLAGLVGELHEALRHSVIGDRFTDEQWTSWRALEPWIVDCIQELDALGFPLALNHGDLHLGNVAGTDAPVVFDWTDACLTHPYLDAQHLARERPDDGYAEDVWAAWTEPWRAAYPGLDHDRARVLAGPVETAFQVATYERIFRAQDPASRGDLLSVVPWLHDRLREAHDAGVSPD